MSEASVLFIPGTVFVFLGIIATSLAHRPIEDRWRIYEQQMLSRGIHVTRTQEWDRLQKVNEKVAIGMICFGVVCWICATIYIGLVNAAFNNSPSPITLNGKNMNMGDYNTCGANLNACPPEIREKYR